METNGAVAIVTGAARGLGKKIAQSLAEQGARVAIVDVLSDLLQETAAELRQSGATILPVVADTTQVSQVDSMADQVDAELGPVDILVNNAGTFSYIGPLWEADPERWFRDIKVNLYGSFLVCRAVVKGMVKRKSGYVVNIVSSGGVGERKWSAGAAFWKAHQRAVVAQAATARSCCCRIGAYRPPGLGQPRRPRLWAALRR